MVDPEPERGFNRLVELAAHVCDTSIACVSLVEERSQWFKAAYGLDPVATPRWESFCAYTILGSDVLEVPDALADDRFASIASVTGPLAIRFYAAAPLLTSSGHAIGTLAVMDRKPRSLSDVQRRLLTILADQTMDQIELRQTAKQAQYSDTRLRRLLEQTSDVAAVMDGAGEVLFVSTGVQRLIGHSADELLGVRALDFAHPDDVEIGQQLLDAAVNEPGVPKVGQIRARHSDGSALHLEVVATSYLDTPDIAGVVVNISDVTDSVVMAGALEESERTFSALVQYSSDIIVVLDEGRIRFVSPAATRLLGYPVEDALGMKVLDLVHPAHRERVHAVLSRVPRNAEPEPVELRLRHADGSYFWFEARGSDLTDDPAIGGTLVNLREIGDRKHYEEQLERLAVEDELTGLANGAVLENRVEHALDRCSEPAACALLYVDMDRFTLVNESAGHEIGDRVLQQIAARLEDTAESADTVARVGADEFAILCGAVEGIDEAVAMSARIHDDLSRPLDIAGRQLRLTTSIGIAMGTGEEQAADLVQGARTAVRVAKERGGARTEVFQERFRAQVVAQVDTLTALQQTIDRDGLSVAYQPLVDLVDLVDRRVVGAEALVRWHHPERGTIPPDAFIGLAEDAGLIGKLGLQMLRRSAEQAAAWEEQSPGHFVTVNVSSRQLSDPSFGDAVMTELRRAGTTVGAVVLELTESSLFASDDVSRSNLGQLDQAGVRMAIDDFGTGYNSLANLRRVGAEMLKIDGSFISDLAESPHDRAVVAAIIELGHALDLIVVAEHVEHEHQAILLSALGCDLGQGHLFGRPGPPDEISSRLVVAARS